MSKNLIHDIGFWSLEKQAHVGSGFDQNKERMREQGEISRK